MTKPHSSDATLPMDETTVCAQPRFSGTVGLLAGGGRFPIYFAEQARKAGIRVVCVALVDHGDAELTDAVDEIHWVRLGQMSSMIKHFKKAHADCVVMAGKVYKHEAMFAPFRIVRIRPDLRMIRLWFEKNRRDNKDDSMILALIDEFNREGLEFASALEICPELLIEPGQWTRRRPSRSERQDILFGWQLAKEMGRLDVGQSVIVKEQAVIAIEAIEGTDKAIRRAAELCPTGGLTVVKVAKPSQDMRFDVPTVGPGTIDSLHAAKATVLALEAGRTIMIDAKETIKSANRRGISIVAVTADQLSNFSQAA